MANEEKRFYGVQFHPEVTHTHQGLAILKRFVLDICGCDALWTSAAIIEDTRCSFKTTNWRRSRYSRALSGGVDSSVTALLLNRAIGKRLTCVFVDNGLLRLNEAEQVMAMFKGKFDLNIIHVEAEDRF